eukprot:m.29798 g.29798  ORF g.29798 m.29798 type:complete len:327 (+) comp14410_c0_seq1:761-1741(+)
MKPIMLNGHERALTQIKYNEDGDLLFSVSKDHVPCVWYSHNGERLGTYQGHNGTVWCCDVAYDSSNLLTGSADNTCKLWDVETGTELCSLDTNSGVRTCGFSYDGENMFFTTDRTMGHDCKVLFYNVASLKQQGTKAEPYQTIVVPKQAPKITAAVWGPLDECIISGHDNGLLVKWDAKTGKRLGKTSAHTGRITDMQTDQDMIKLITSSKDTTAKLWDIEDLRVLKNFQTERPVNSACISPLRPHIMLGGGQEAMEVTTSSQKQGKFFARLYHMVYEEELGKIKGHFGPINSLAWSKDGKSYASGAEDGYVRIHMFDSTYYEQFE